LDLGIEVILEIFSSDGLEDIFQAANIEGVSENSQRIFALRDFYLKTIDGIISFLQGKNQNFARQICSPNFLPRSARFEQVEDLELFYGNMGIQDKAKHLATMYLEDLADFIKECIDENFGFSRYAERLGRSANSFDELLSVLNQTPTYIDRISIKKLAPLLEENNPSLVCFSVPFPGNLYSAFRCAGWIRDNYPNTKIALGGGFPNTELRSITDARVFDFFHFITLDDGELPLELLISHIKEPSDTNPNYNFLKRTFLRLEDKVVYNNFSLRQDYKHSQVGTPDYSDLPLSDYISVIEVSNPMHSLWSDGRWNKLTMAHGCYWGKCTFCDITLDYIGNYQPMTAKLLVDRMEELIEQTGEHGFHFVDEAAPPKLMRDLALEIIKRKIVVTWWTNIRFEKNFTSDLCQLLKASGCVAVSGGLEVASDRLLALIDKGVSVEQVAQVTRNFSDSGIMVHSYLMYGYPTQTIQETIDSLEMVRQLFEAGVIQSGFWHQFALTAHSPIGIDPDKYNITPKKNQITFANNDIDFVDSTGIDHEIYSQGLKKSLFNYMHNMCFDYHLQEWFDFEIPETTIAHEYIQDCLALSIHAEAKPTSKLVWLSPTPRIISQQGDEFVILQIHLLEAVIELEMSKKKASWLQKKLSSISVLSGAPINYLEFKNKFTEEIGSFEDWWRSEDCLLLRENGLLVL